MFVLKIVVWVQTIQLWLCFIVMQNTLCALCRPLRVIYCNIWYYKYIQATQSDTETVCRPALLHCLSMTTVDHHHYLRHHHSYHQYRCFSVRKSWNWHHSHLCNLFRQSSWLSTWYQDVHSMYQLLIMWTSHIVCL